MDTRRRRLESKAAASEREVLARAALQDVKGRHLERLQRFAVQLGKGEVAVPGVHRQVRLIHLTLIFRYLPS